MGWLCRFVLNNINVRGFCVCTSSSINHMLQSPDSQEFQTKALWACSWCHFLLSCPIRIVFSITAFKTHTAPTPARHHGSSARAPAAPFISSWSRAQALSWHGSDPIIMQIQDWIRSLFAFLDRQPNSHNGFKRTLNSTGKTGCSSPRNWSWNKGDVVSVNRIPIYYCIKDSYITQRSV